MKNTENRVKFMWKTGQLAKYFGIDRSVLHYYDAEGLLHAQKSENNYRVYDTYDLIALCEARHLRSMGFPLKEAGDLIRHADESATKSRLDAREQEIDLEIQRLNTIKYLIGSFQGKHRPIAREFYVLKLYDYGAFYYLPLESSRPGAAVCRDYKALSNLVKDAPFINYCFHFPPESGTCRTRFQFEFGVSFQDWWRNLTPEALPHGIQHCQERKALFTLLPLKNRDVVFQYEDFDFVRDYCATNNLSWTGEAMVFPSMKFYSNADEFATANLYFFLN